MYMRELNLSAQICAETRMALCGKGVYLAVSPCARVTCMPLPSRTHLPGMPLVFSHPSSCPRLCFTSPPSSSSVHWLILPLPNAPGPPTPPAAVTVLEPRGRRGPRRGAALRTDRAPRSPTSATPGTRRCPALPKAPWAVSETWALLEQGTAFRQRLANDLLSSLWDKDNGPKADYRGAEAFITKALRIVLLVFSL